VHVVVNVLTKFSHPQSICSCTQAVLSLLRTVLVSAAAHQLYWQPVEDGTYVCSYTPAVLTACWRRYLCLQLHTSCTDSLLKTVLVPSAAHQLYRQPVEDRTFVCSCTPAVLTACWRQYFCLQLHTLCTDSLLKTVLVSAAAHQLYWQPVDDSICVRTVTTFHPLVLSHENPLLVQKNCGQNCVLKLNGCLRENERILYLTERKVTKRPWIRKVDKVQNFSYLNQKKGKHVLVFFFLFCIIVTIKGDKFVFFYSRSFETK
jgi:hypothetical protein